MYKYINNFKNIFNYFNKSVLNLDNQVVHTNKSKYNKSGFTLIEVMIVILIGGALLAGAFAGFRWYRNSQVTATRSKANSLRFNVEQYRTTIGQVPTSLEDLKSGPQDPKLRRKWGEPLVTDEDLKDVWGREFIYEPNPRGNPPYEIYSLGSDGTGENKIYPNE